jgi:hypothetical protein
MFSSFSFMSQLNSGAYRIGGRLFKSAVTSVFALSALAGGVVLSGGEAQAMATCLTFGPTGPFTPNPCVDGNYSIVNYDTDPSTPGDQFGPTLYSPGGMNTVKLEQLHPHEVLVEVNFDPVVNTGGADGEFWYSVEETTGKKFVASKLAFTDGMSDTGSIFKYIYSDDTFSTLVQTLHVDDAMPMQTKALSGGYTKLYVRDVYTGTGIVTMQNNFQTPGPLPVLGAGAAFGFSRKLRSRIKAARAV